MRVPGTLQVSYPEGKVAGKPLFEIEKNFTSYV